MIIGGLWQHSPLFLFWTTCSTRSASGLQPPAWVVEEVQRRLVLLLNHVLMQEPEAQARLARQAGRVVEARWRAFVMRLVATPAGLLDLAPSAAPARPDAHGDRGIALGAGPGRAARRQAGGAHRRRRAVRRRDQLAGRPRALGPRGRPVAAGRRRARPRHRRRGRGKWWRHCASSSAAAPGPRRRRRQALRTVQGRPAHDALLARHLHRLGRPALRAGRAGAQQLPAALAAARWPASSRSAATCDAPRGQRLRKALEHLGPIFVKFGQVLSTRRDLLPADVADELARLQDRVPPFDSSVAIATIERAFRRPVDDDLRQLRARAGCQRLDRAGALRHAASTRAATCARSP